MKHIFRILSTLMACRSVETREFCTAIQRFTCSGARRTRRPAPSAAVVSLWFLRRALRNRRLSLLNEEGIDRLSQHVVQAAIFVERDLLELLANTIFG